jgi:hypothetical protein
MQHETPLPADLDGRQARHRQLFAKAAERIGGRLPWRKWKQQEADDLVALAHKAARMEVLELDLRADFVCVYRVRMPVPRAPVGGELQIGREAIFHLVYQEPWLWEGPRGWDPLGVLFPPDLFHPEARPAVRGALCLGLLPPGTRTTEIVLLGYYMLSLQAVQLNELDPNGVLNAEACDYFRSHPQYVPLTRAGLFEDLEPRKEAS